jgi:hypothetical protein
MSEKRNNTYLKDATNLVLVENGITDPGHQHHSDQDRNECSAVLRHFEQSFIYRGRAEQKYKVRKFQGA